MLFLGITRYVTKEIILTASYIILIFVLARIFSIISHARSKNNEIYLWDIDRKHNISLMWISKLAKMFPHLSKILSNSDGFFSWIIFIVIDLYISLYNSRLSLWTLAWWHYKYIPKDLCPKMYAPLSQTAWHPGLGGCISHSHLLWHRDGRLRSQAPVLYHAIPTLSFHSQASIPFGPTRIQKVFPWDF